jgi:hypothetical protein
MAKAKKLIRVEPYVDKREGLYVSNKIKFALMAKSKSVRKQVAKFCTCRDYISDILRARAHGKSFSGFYKHDPKGEFAVDMSRLRLLVGRDDLDAKEEKDFRRKIFSAKRLINLYENEGGWSKSSVITTIKFKENEDTGRKTSAWLLTGPKEWLAYSQLVSMITLIFRIASNHGPIEFNDNNSAEKWFYKLILKQQANRADKIYRYDSDVASYLPHCWDKFYMIATEYDKIFTQPMEEAYPLTGEVHASGGVYHLCSFNTNNKVLDGNMKKVYEKYSKAREKHKNRLMKEAEKELKKGI